MFYLMTKIVLGLEASIFGKIEDTTAPKKFRVVDINPPHPVNTQKSDHRAISFTCTFNVFCL